MPLCDRCDRWFNTDAALDQHERMSSNHWMCYDCEIDFASEWGRIQHWVQSPRHHYCQRCDEHFDSSDDLREHYSDAHWYCRFCNKIFDSQLGLREHNRQKHWLCTVCDRAFMNENNLNQHKRTHVPKTIQCPLRGCSRAFSSRADLVLHLESGTCPSGVGRDDVRRLVARLDRAGLITDTRRLIAGPDGARAPPPPVRYVATERSWNGSAYECVLCHRAHARLQDLNRHLASAAHDEKLFHCPRAADGCGTRFGTVSALVQHVEAGTCGVRRFQRQLAGVMDELTNGMRLLTC